MIKVINTLTGVCVAKYRETTDNLETARRICAELNRASEQLIGLDRARGGYAVINTGQELAG